MATTKTIQPTGTTITMPAMTDKPDASVFSTDVDRITDAVNALNSNIVNKQATTSSAITGGIWIDDFCNLPMPTQRTIYNIYNSNAGKSGMLLKRNDGKIRLSEDLQADTTIYISGVNS